MMLDKLGRRFLGLVTFGLTTIVCGSFAYCLALVPRCWQCWKTDQVRKFPPDESEGWEEVEAQGLTGCNPFAGGHFLCLRCQREWLPFTPWVNMEKSTSEQGSSEIQVGGLLGDDSKLDRIFSNQPPALVEAESGDHIQESGNAMDFAPPDATQCRIETIERKSQLKRNVGIGSAEARAYFYSQPEIEAFLEAATNANDSKDSLRSLTAEASGELIALLHQINSNLGVIGSVVMGHDGLLLASTMPEGMDAESVGVWSLGLWMNTEHVTKKMGCRVNQIVLKSRRGTLVFVDFGGGLLVTITDEVGV